MRTARSTGRRAAAMIAASAILALSAGPVLAHPGTEADHGGSSCIVVAEPHTVAAGGQFTVTGTFGGAEIFVLPGANAQVPEDGTPSATTPQGSSFSVTFTALGPGELTITAFIEGSECGDTDHVTVTGTLPNTAAEPSSAAALITGLTLILGAAGVGLRRIAPMARR